MNKKVYYSDFLNSNIDFNNLFIFYDDLKILKNILLNNLYYNINSPKQKPSINDMDILVLKNLKELQISLLPQPTKDLSLNYLIDLSLCDFSTIKEIDKLINKEIEKVFINGIKARKFYTSDMVHFFYNHSFNNNRRHTIKKIKKELQKINTFIHKHF